MAWDCVGCEGATERDVVAMKEIIVPIDKERRLRYVIRDNIMSNTLYLEYRYVDQTDNGERSGWDNGGGTIYLDGEEWVSLDEFADAVERLRKLLVLG